MERPKDREAELGKYVYAYDASKYRMGKARGRDAKRELDSLPMRGSYLDVSCGRGEMLAFAESIGFTTVQGTEIVPKLIDGKRVVQAWVHALPFPDRSFDVVTMHDVIEHLVPGDDELACKELARVAKSYVMLTANNHPSFNRRGDDLHINKRPYAVWDDLFHVWFSPHTVTWLKDPQREYVSEAWRIEIEGPPLHPA